MPASPYLQQLFAAASAAHQQGHLPEAEAGYQQLLQIAPRHADTLHLLGLAISQQGRHAEALDWIARAVECRPSDAQFLHNLGEVHRRLGGWVRASQCYREALAIAPGFVEAQCHLADVLKPLGQQDEAIALYRGALAQSKGEHFPAAYNLGNTLMELGRYRSAIEAFEVALRIRPDSAEAHNNFAVVLAHWDRREEAIAHHREAIRLKPDFQAAHQNLVRALEADGRIAEARVAFQELARWEGNDPFYGLCRANLCPLVFADNVEIDTYRSRLAKALGRLTEDVVAPSLGNARLQLYWSNLTNVELQPPSGLIYQGRDDRPLKEAFARVFDKLLAPLRCDEMPTRRKLTERRPRVGFVVTAGHEGVFLKGMRGMINELPREQFRVTVVCSGPNGETILRTGLAPDREVEFLSLPAGRLDAAVEAIRAAEFNLLHFWEVGTDALNYFLPFCRLAPVQCTSWGWPVTSGVPQMDYFLSCEGLETEEGEAHHTERLVRFRWLPTFYYRPPMPAPARIGSARQRFGLPLTGKGRVYFCAQNLRKVHPDFDALVAGILRDDSLGMVAFVEDKAPAVTGDLRARLSRSLSAKEMERVRFLPRVEESEYLALLAACDLALDTLHYGGGANTCYDAFACGTPLVTLPGRYHRSRYAAAACRQAGWIEGIATSEADYITRALRLAALRGSERAAERERIVAAGGELFEDAKAVAELAGFIAGKTIGVD